MCRIYEDMILEKIPSSRYEILNSQYETEQRALSKEIKDLELTISRYEKETDRARKFISLINRYENFDELTTTMINEFVEKIIIHERDRKGSQNSKQKIEIYFNFYSIACEYCTYAGTGRIAPIGQEKRAHSGGAAL